MSNKENFISVLRKVYKIEGFSDPSKKYCTNDGEYSYEKTVGHFEISETENKILKWFNGLKEEKKNNILEQMLIDQKVISSVHSSYENLEDFFLKPQWIWFGKKHRYVNDNPMFQIGREIMTCYEEMCSSLLKKYGCKVRYECDHSFFYLDEIEELPMIRRST